MRVHPELLGSAAAAAALVGKQSGSERYEDIARFERLPPAQRHVDPEVLPARVEGGAEEALPRRLDEPEKNWKFSHRRHAASAALERYMDAYEDDDPRHRTPHAPWFVVPADNKWFTRLVVAAAIVDAVE